MQPIDLAIMTGNVAQHIPDGDWPRTLDAIRARMRPGGILAFESRNPADRAWEAWAAEGETSRESVHGPLVECMDVERADGRVVRLAARTRFVDAAETVTTTLALTFRSRAELERDLVRAGFAVETVHGGWHDEPLTDAARIMLVVARAR